MKIQIEKEVQENGKEWINVYLNGKIEECISITNRSEEEAMRLAEEVVEKIKLRKFNPVGKTTLKEIEI